MSRDREKGAERAAVVGDAPARTAGPAALSAVRLAFEDAVTHLEQGIAARDYFAANYWVARGRLHQIAAAARVGAAASAEDQEELERLRALRTRFEQAEALAPEGGEPSMAAMGAWLAKALRDATAAPAPVSPLRPENVRPDGLSYGDLMDLGMGALPSWTLDHARQHPDPITRTVAETAYDLTHDAPYLGGFALGTAQGTAMAVRDFLKGVPDAVMFVADIQKTLMFEGGVALFRKAVGAVEALVKAAPELAEWLDDKWNATDSYARGEFRGEVGGYGVTMIALAVAAAYAGPLAALAGEWAFVIRAIEAVDMLGDVTSLLRPLGLVGKGARAAGGLSHGADSLGDLVTDARHAGTRATHDTATGDTMTDVPHGRGHADDVTAAAPAAEMVGSSGNGAWATGSKPGEAATPDTIRYGTVAMELHPDYPRLIAEAEAKGFHLSYGSPPRVALIHVVDESGALLEIRRNLQLERGMRFLDLEHEIGHVRQLDRFGDSPPPTAKVIRTADGQERAAHGTKNAGSFTSAENAVVEYHNRLDEYVRIASRGAPPDVIADHAQGVRDWLRDASTAGLGQGGGRGSFHRWAKEHFPDIPELEEKARALGLELGPTKARW